MKYKNFYIDCGGDIQTISQRSRQRRGSPEAAKVKGQKWKIGIKNPFKQEEIVKVVYLANEGIATSGTYIRGGHIYNPKGGKDDGIVSLTVIGPNVYEADRFATAAFAMGEKGIGFIERLKGC